MRAATQRLIDRARAPAPPGSTPTSSRRCKAFLPGSTTNTSRSSATASTSWSIDGGERRAAGVAGLGPGDPARRAADAVTRSSARRRCALARAPHLLVLTKANSRATVHRPAYLDYVGVKRFDADGDGDRRAALPRPVHDAPPTRRARARSRCCAARSSACSSRAGFPPDSHDAKALIEILESLPARLAVPDRRPTSCSTIAMGILGLGERQRVRLFVRRDPLDRFVSCLVCIPRDRFNTENRERVGRILVEAFGGDPRRLDAAAVRVGARARPLPRAHCPTGVARATTWPRSRRGSSRRRAPGPTTCATRWSRSTARSTGRELFKRYERRVPARLPGRLGRARGGRRHRPASRSSRRRAGAIRS